MRVAFFDPISWDYSVQTPLERPLGGSQSAICYLATQLSADGVDVTLINNTSTPGTYAGVRCLDRTQGLVPQVLEQVDVIVVVNSAIGRRLRGAVGNKTRLVLWSHHDTNAPEIATLRDPAERKTWDAFALVSKWQALRYEAMFSVDPRHIVILRNAVAPPFEILRRRRAPWFTSGEAPLLAYTSTPYRGLEILLDAFPMIRSAVPGIRLKVFAGMRVYQLSEAEDTNREIYHRCSTTPDVEYIGNVSQVALAQELANVDILAYPSIFAETSCISVMEAMAAGCFVVSSTLAALPETTGGFGALVPIHADLEEFTKQYSHALVEVVERGNRDPGAMSANLEKQIAFARSAYSWKTRAKEWRHLISYLSSS